MNEQQIQNLLYTKPKDKMVEMFDNLTCPPIGAFFSIYDIQYLYNIATSVKLTSKPKVKYRMIDDLMKPKGFVRLHAGTNRIVYRHLDITSFVAKIAIDDKGLGDNPAEYRNQVFLKPFVTKTFEVTYNGVLAFSERVDPITSLASFLLISPDVFDVLVYKILGNYVIDDVGSDYFMNWGVRKGIGPCLLDYPYVYNLDSNKLYCNRPVYPNTKFPVCNGEIDYDEGFNNLVCTVCGKRYIAKDLAKDIENNLVYFKGGSTMDEITAKIRIYKGNKLLNSDIQESASIKKPLAQFSSYGVLEIPKITIKRGKTIIACSGGVDNKKSVSKQKQVEHSTSSERKTNNYKPNYNNSTKKEEVVEADPIVPVQNDPLKEARERLKLKNAIKAETEITMPEVPDGLVEDKFVSKPIPVIIPEGMPMNDNEEQRQYNIEHINNVDGAKNINNENFGPLSQGFMSGISVDSVCGIVSGRSYEEIKAIEAKEKQEALEKTKEESVVLPADQVSNDHSFTQFEEVENDENDEEITEPEVVEESKVEELEVEEPEVEEPEEVKEAIDLSVLKGFKPGISKENNSNVVYSTSVERKDELAAKKERRIEFFKRLDAKLDYTFSRKVDTCEDQEEIIKECIETLKAYVEDFDSEKFFIYDYEEYVNKFIDISCYQNVYTIDVLEPNSRLLEKY